MNILNTELLQSEREMSEIDFLDVSFERLTKENLAMKTKLAQHNLAAQNNFLYSLLYAHIASDDEFFSWQNDTGLYFHH